MIELITLDEYFNMVGKELCSEWSTETVHYFSERKKELNYLRKDAIKTYSAAIKRIWRDGKVKVSLRLEQGYIDPPFVIDEFYFAQSACTSADGGYYRCKIEIDKETRGRPKQFTEAEIDDVIREYVLENYISEGVSLYKIKHAPVIRYVLEFFERTSNEPPPANNTIGNRLKKIYPQCSKAGKDSNK